LKSMHFELRFRTRLALVMFITMTCTGPILTWSYVEHGKQILNYVAGETSRLLTVSQLAQTQIPAKTSVDDALKIYQKKLQDLGFNPVSTTSKEGLVVASTNPGQVGKKILFKKKHIETKPVRFPAEFPALDSS